MPKFRGTGEAYFIEQDTENSQPPGSSPALFCRMKVESFRGPVTCNWSYFLFTYWQGSLLQVETFFFNWCIAELQCCVSFRCAAKWFGYINIHIHTFFQLYVYIYITKYIYISCFRFFSLISYYRILSGFPCAVQ